MQNTYNPLHKSTSIGLMTAGMFMLIVSNETASQAQDIATNQGAMLKPSIFHAAASVSPIATIAEGQMIFGMFLLLLGFLIHALIVIHSDTHVPVHAKKKSKKKMKRPMYMRVLLMQWK